MMAAPRAPHARHALRHALRRYGEVIARLEPNWYLVFLLLERHGARSVGELAVALQWAPASVAAVAARMHERGLVDAIGEPGPRHEPRVRLSPHGRAQMVALRRALDALLEA